MSWGDVHRLLFFIPHFIRALKVLPIGADLLRAGGISLITSFHYPSSGQNAQWQFRTVIQLDGDVINFVPPLEHHTGNLEWSKVYEEHYRLHQATVEKILADLGGLYTLPWMIDIGLSLILVIAPLKMILIQEFTLLNAVGLFMSWGVFTTLCKRFLNPQLSRIFLYVLFRKQGWVRRLNRLIRPANGSGQR